MDAAGDVVEDDDANDAVADTHQDETNAAVDGSPYNIHGYTRT